MKKKIMSIISLVAIVMAIGYNIYSSQKRYVVLSDLVLAPKLYSAVKGTLSSNGSLKRINDDNGKCIFKLLINVSTAADCKM